MANSMAPLSRTLYRSLLSNHAFSHLVVPFCTSTTNPDPHPDSEESSFSADHPASVPNSSSPTGTTKTEASSEQRQVYDRPLENGLDVGIYKAIVVGQVGQPPWQKRLRSGKTVTMFSMGTGGIRNNRRPLENENPREYANRCAVQWHRVTVYPDRLGSVVIKHVAPGSIVYVEGNLETKVFSDPTTGLVRRVREVAIRQDGSWLIIGKGNKQKRPASCNIAQSFESFKANQHLLSFITLKKRMDNQGNTHQNTLVNFFMEHTVVVTPQLAINLCTYKDIPDSSSPWQNASPWLSSVPFTSHIAFVIMLIRFFLLLSNLARQPRFLAELMCGLVLGPVGLGQNTLYSEYLRPVDGNVVDETMANLAVVYYMFLVGLEMDLTTIKRVEKKVLANTAAGILFPSCVGAGLYLMFISIINTNQNPVGALYWAAALTATSFPDLARILSDLKLLHTDIGRVALSSAFLSDLVAWIFVVFLTTLFNGNTPLAIIPTLVFILFCWFVVRPILSWAISYTSSKGGTYSETCVYFILTGVLICGLITDALGSNSMVGAFMLGLIMPNGELVTRIMDKLEGYVTGILLPFFFVVTGTRITPGHLIRDNVNPALMWAIVILAVLPKIVSAFLVSIFYGMPAREGVALGTLMNTKGVLAVIILNVGRDTQALDNDTFTLMILAIFAMTLFVKPIPHLYCTATKRFKRYKRRNLESSQGNSELRVLMCVHESQNLSGLLNLLEFSNPTKQKPIYVFAAHLVQLTRRSTAMLIVHETDRCNSQNHRITQETAKAGHILSALENYKSRGQALPIQAVTVVSPYATMHKDIYHLAEDRRSSLILIPFHKQSSSNENVQIENSSFRQVNQNLLASAPCSVGILIDRGLGSNIDINGSNHRTQRIRVAMLFAGGPDNREALAYAWRMAGAWEVNLTVVRFLPGKEAEIMFDEVVEAEHEGSLDDQYINEFRFQTMCDQSITYAEKLINTGDEILSVVGEKFGDYDLYIVGKGRGVESSLTSGISEWSEYEELGAIGDALSTSEFAKDASILVLQQYQNKDASKLL